MQDVFISYSRHDSEFVRRLHDAFAAAERPVWVDFEDIPLTSDWWREIQTGIEAASSLLFVVSPDSLTSVVCNLELEYARQRSKRIIPIIRRATDREAALPILEGRPIDLNVRQLLDGRIIGEIGRANYAELGKFNWLFFEDDALFEARFAQLITALDTDYDYVREHTRLLTRALEWDRNRRNPGYLLNGAEIEVAETWLSSAAGKDPAPADLHTEYIINSRRTAQARGRRLLGAGAVALVITTTLAIIAFLFFRDSQANLGVAQVRGTEVAAGATQVARERDTSEALRLASEGSRMLEAGAQNAELAALLGVDSLKAAPSAQGYTLTLRALQALYLARRFEGYEQLITSVDFAPDGQSILIVTGGSAAQLLDRSGAVIETITYTDSLTTGTFSPGGELLLLGSADGSAHLWDIEAGAFSQSFGTHRDIITSAAFSPDGTQIITASGDGMMRLWDAISGDEIAAIPTEAGILGVAFSPDRRWIAAGMQDGTVGLWRASSMLDVLPAITLAEHDSVVNCVAFSPDGGQIITGSNDRTARLWDAESGERQFILAGHEGGVTSCEFSPTGDTVVTGSLDGTARVWDVVTGGMLRHLTGHSEMLLDVAFSPDGESALTGSLDKTARLWNLQIGQPLFVFRRHEATITSVGFSPDSQTLYTIGKDARVYRWSVETQQALPGFDSFGSEAHMGVLSPDVATVYFATDATAIHFFDLASRRQLGVLNPPDVNGMHFASDLAISPDGSLLLVPSSEGVARLWDIASGTLRHTWEHEALIYYVAFAPDSLLAATSAMDGTVQVWETGSGAQRYSFDLFAAADTDTELPFSIAAQALAFNPAGDLLAVGTAEGRIFLLDSGSGEQLRDWTAHDGGVTALAFSPDGRSLATGAADQLIQVWDVGSGELRASFGGSEGSISNLAFSPDGTYLLSSDDRTARLWFVQPADMIAFACGRLFRADLTNAERRTFTIRAAEPICPTAD
jgi:WD40 repeat protein